MNKRSKSVQNSTARGHERGSSLLEILVTVLIMATGLLGLAGFMVRQQNQEMDSYQRAQALLLVNDMSQRLQANRANAANYITGTDITGKETLLGVGMTCGTTTNTSTIAQQDLNAWCNSLQGAAETMGTQGVGAMVGARGCVVSIGAQQYAITVVWQGMMPIAAPSNNNLCGKGLYDVPSGSPCVEDLCRRSITTLVRIGNLAPA
jgi:type IV pilus assembly protein PilV